MFTEAFCTFVMKLALFSKNDWFADHASYSYYLSEVLFLKRYLYIRPYQTVSRRYLFPEGGSTYKNCFSS